ncbi:putative secreted protein [Wickerhamomyces ciferrii]|uniref:Secreted protein n=1 Tax=Wickerhamomyces ciferrii (strain ATCC 14091 / BCRC 22168 / CBS 111 / JCM 3599 / NBRC 0793 / NRRL Y-1031 F-60-10) TaxID=1206466 RepID=K0KRC7_WICCF|nr:uncharacterized protein BN7_3417 [Wickerhamomyces ciferrii]CCH43863.1 putative secreted protein [Wickerhamomyces ciferrii]
MQVQQVVASFLASSSLFGTQQESNAVANNDFAVVRGHNKVVSNGSNNSNGSNSTSSSINGAALASGNGAVLAAGVAGLAAFLL